MLKIYAKPGFQNNIVLCVYAGLYNHCYCILLYMGVFF